MAPTVTALATVAATATATPITEAADTPRCRMLLGRIVELARQVHILQGQLGERHAFSRQLETEIRHWEKAIRVNMQQIADAGGKVPTKRCNGPCGLRKPVTDFPLRPSRLGDWAFRAYCLKCDDLRIKRIKRARREYLNRAGDMNGPREMATQFIERLKDVELGELAERYEVAAVA